MNTIEKSLADYYGEIDFTHNSICEECRRAAPDLLNPIGTWVVGNEFPEHKTRVLFVGKTARGIPGERYNDYMLPYQSAREILWNKAWPYWSYTRQITKAVYGNDSIENIAFTNMVKCNNGSTVDTTIPSTKECCLSKLGVFRKEVEIINPTHIVFYTGRSYGEYLNSIFDQISMISETDVQIGKKRMPWIDGVGVINENKYRFLCVGHPERLKQTDFVGSISEWIQNTK